MSDALSPLERRALNGVQLMTEAEGCSGNSGVPCDTESGNFPNIEGAAFAALPLAGSTRECPKCRFGMLTYRYTTCYWVDGWTEHRYRDPLLVAGPERGLLVRACPQCSAELFERPADSVADYEEMS